MMVSKTGTAVLLATFIVLWWPRAACSQSTLHGVVTKKKDSTPIKGATVTARLILDTTSVLKARRPTDSKGVYNLEGLDSGLYKIVVTHPMYSKTWRDDIWVPESTGESIDFTLKSIGQASKPGYESSLPTLGVRLGFGLFNGTKPFPKGGLAYTPKWPSGRLHPGVVATIGFASNGFFEADSLTDSEDDKNYLFALQPAAEVEFNLAQRSFALGLSPVVNVFFDNEFNGFVDLSFAASIRSPEVFGSVSAGMAIHYYDISEVGFGEIGSVDESGWLFELTVEIGL